MFFAVSGLDVLNSLHLIPPYLRQDLIDWIYGGLVVPRDNEKRCGGFMVSINSCLSGEQTLGQPHVNRASWYFLFHSQPNSLSLYVARQHTLRQTLAHPSAHWLFIQPADTQPVPFPSPKIGISIGVTSYQTN